MAYAIAYTSPHQVLMCKLICSNNFHTTNCKFYTRALKLRGWTFNHGLLHFNGTLQDHYNKTFVKSLSYLHEVAQELSKAQVLVLRIPRHGLSSIQWLFMNGPLFGILYYPCWYLTLRTATIHLLELLRARGIHHALNRVSKLPKNASSRSNVKGA